MDQTVDIYLDVDGVLNAVTFSGVPKGWQWGDVEVVRVNGYLIKYAPAMIERLNALAARDGVRFHWLTTWCQDAPTKLCEAIGLHGQDWPVVGEAEHAKHEFTPWWKHTAIKAHHSDDHPVVWVDDDIPFDSKAVRWLSEKDINFLAIAPRTETGMNPHQMKQIEEFVNERL